MDHKSVVEMVAELGIDQEILDHIFVNEDRISTDLLPGGVPYMKRNSGNLWSGAYSFDDMRGPQGRFTNVPFEESFGNIVQIVERMIKNPNSDYYYYHPDKKTQK